MPKFNKSLDQRILMEVKLYRERKIEQKIKSMRYPKIMKPIFMANPSIILCQFFIKAPSY